MEALFDYILQFGHLSQQHLAQVAEKAFELHLRKDEYFSEAGKIPRQVGFVLEGVVRGWYIGSEGTEITRCFVAENSLVVDYPNFEGGAAATEFLQAATDCRLLVFAKRDWEALSAIPGWDAIKNRMVQQCMYLKSRRGPVISQPATTRYLEFLSSHPSLVNRVPLAYIASYLGVTQQSLSRIRRGIR